MSIYERNKIFLINLTIKRNIYFLGNDLGLDISTADHPKVGETLFAESLTEIHCLSLVHLIDCRIGIFDGKNWKHYGIWNKSDANVLTILLFLKNGTYCPIFSLKN